LTYHVIGSTGSSGPGKRGPHLHYHCTSLGNSAASRYYLCAKSGSCGRDGITFSAAGEAGAVLPTVAAGSQQQ